MIASDQLRDTLVQTDEDFRHLSEQHRELETRLAELSHHLYRSAPEEAERMTLKKRKLQLKDQMEEMLKRRRQVGGTVASPLQTDARG